MQSVLPAARGKGGTDLDGQPGCVVGRPAMAVLYEEPQHRPRARHPSEQFEEAAEIGLRELSLGRILPSLPFTSRSVRPNEEIIAVRHSVQRLSAPCTQFPPAHEPGRDAFVGPRPLLGGMKTRAYRSTRQVFSRPRCRRIADAPKPGDRRSVGQGLGMDPELYARSTLSTLVHPRPAPGRTLGGSVQPRPSGSQAKPSTCSTGVTERSSRPIEFRE